MSTGKRKRNYQDTKSYQATPNIILFNNVALSRVSNIDEILNLLWREPLPSIQSTCLDFRKRHKNLCECSTCSERKVVKCPFGSAATLGLLCALNHWLRVRDLNVVGLQPKSKLEQSMILKWLPTTTFFLPPLKPDRDLRSKSSVSLSPTNPPDRTIESSSSLSWVRDANSLEAFQSGRRAESIGFGCTCFAFFLESPLGLSWSLFSKIVIYIT